MLPCLVPTGSRSHAAAVEVPLASPSKPATPNKSRGGKFIRIKKSPKAQKKAQSKSQALLRAKELAAKLRDDNKEAKEENKELKAELKLLKRDLAQDRSNFRIPRCL